MLRQIQNVTKTLGRKYFTFKFTASFSSKRLFFVSLASLESET